MTARLHIVGTGTPSGISVQGARLNIAAAAHSRGVAVTSGGRFVRTIPAAGLCGIIRAALENATGDNLARVGTVVQAIARGIRPNGAPVEVPNASLNMLTGMGRKRKSQ